MIYLRNNKVNTCYLGDKKLNKIYLGDKLVWPQKKSFDANGHDFVEIAGIKWATKNVGAQSETDYGLYFQWGDTKGYSKDQIGEDKQFDWSDYKWSINGSSSNFSKYKTTGATLELEDDAAHVNMGGDWHMPTPTQIQELINETTNTWTTQDGVNGRLFTSKTDASKSIFIPAAGSAWDDSVGNRDSSGYVWSSMLSSSGVNFGQNLYFHFGNARLYSNGRDYGFSVRGVLG